MRANRRREEAFEARLLGRGVCSISSLFGDDTPQPAAPDLTPIKESTEAAAKIAADSAAADLAFRTRVYDEAQPGLTEAKDLALGVARDQRDLATETAERGTAQWNQYLGTYQPVEGLSAADALESGELSTTDAARLNWILNDPAAIRDMDPAVRNAEIADWTRKARDNSIARVERERVSSRDDTLGTIDTESKTLTSGITSEAGGLYDLVDEGGVAQRGVLDKSEGASRQLIDEGGVAEYKRIDEDERQRIGKVRGTVADRLLKEQQSMRRTAGRYGMSAGRGAARAGDLAIRSAATDASMTTDILGDSAKDRLGVETDLLDRRLTLEKDLRAQRLGVESDVAGSRLGVGKGAAQGRTTVAQNRASDVLSTRTTSGKDIISARDTARERGVTLRAGTANFGRNMPNTAASAYGLTIRGGDSATTNSLAGANANLPVANFVAAGTTPQLQSAGLKQTGALGYGGLLNTNYSNQLYGWNAAETSSNSMWGGLGSLVGSLGSAYLLKTSSKDAKTDKTAVNDDLILDGLEAIPVEAWRYKRGTEDGGAQRHIGPYAEDVHEQFGDEAAPGGQGLDLVSMNGIALAGIKALAKKVRRLEQGAGLEMVRPSRMRDTEPRRATA